MKARIPTLWLSVFFLVFHRVSIATLLGGWSKPSGSSDNDIRSNTLNALERHISGFENSISDRMYPLCDEDFDTVQLSHKCLKFGDVINSGQQLVNGMNYCSVFYAKDVCDQSAPTYVCKSIIWTHFSEQPPDLTCFQCYPEKLSFSLSCP